MYWPEIFLGPGNTEEKGEGGEGGTGGGELFCLCSDLPHWSMKGGEGTWGEEHRFLALDRN
jgi:hypothetical protein